MEKPSIIIDVHFNSIGSTAKNVQGDLRLEKGQVVTINIPHGPGGNIIERSIKPTWPANNDPVLEVKENGWSATITASEIGKSELFIKLGWKILRKITIDVVQSPAVEIVLEVGTPEQK